MGGVVHHKYDACDNLHHQAERQNDAPDPHPVQVLGRGDHDGVVKDADNRQAAVKPLFSASRRFVMIVRNSGHGQSSPYPSLIVVSSVNSTTGIGRLRGAGPLRMRPAVS